MRRNRTRSSLGCEDLVQPWFRALNDGSAMSQRPGSCTATSTRAPLTGLAWRPSSRYRALDQLARPTGYVLAVDFKRQHHELVWQNARRAGLPIRPIRAVLQLALCETYDDKGNLIVFEAQGRRSMGRRSVAVERAQPLRMSRDRRSATSKHVFYGNRTLTFRPDGGGCAVQPTIGFQPGVR